MIADTEAYALADNGLRPRATEPRWDFSTRTVFDGDGIRAGQIPLFELKKVMRIAFLHVN